jgi:hypothetical protein
MSTKQTLLQPVKGLLLLVVISAFVSTRLLAQDEPVTKQTPPLPNQAAAYANGTVMKTSHQPVPGRCAWHQHHQHGCVHYRTQPQHQHPVLVLLRTR